MKKTLSIFIAACSFSCMPFLYWACFDFGDDPEILGEAIGKFNIQADLLGWSGNENIRLIENGSVVTFNVDTKAKSSVDFTNQAIHRITDTHVYYSPMPSATESCCAPLFRRMLDQNSTPQLLLDTIFLPIVLSGDQNHIAYRRSQWDDTVRVLNVSTSQVLVTQLPEALAHSPVLFSTDNQRLVYQMAQPPAGGDGYNETQYGVVHLVSGENVIVDVGFPESLLYRLVGFYWEGSTLEVMHYQWDGANCWVRLKDTSTGELTEIVNLKSGYGVSWLPELNLLKYFVEKGRTLEWWIYDLGDGSHDKILSSNTNTAEGPLFISPDGSRGVYTYASTSSTQLEIHIISLD